jgi:CRISPR/Cas system-associated exonuclease Cas4 (RecB family)
MGLASLIKVAQGKNAGNVSFEDNFIKEYQNAVKRQKERERQPVPKDYFRPSSMYGCDRMLFFMRAHCRNEGTKDDVDTNLVEICNSGTDRHLRIQKLVADMEGVECLDLEEVVKEAQQKGIKTEFVGWNEDKTEARCKNEEMSLYFQPDGVIRFMGKEVILEIKTESTYQHSNRYEPKPDHKYQATCYGLGLGIDYVLFLYEDRNFCGKKAYLWKITDEMKAEVLSKIARVNKAISVGIPPEKNEDKCTYCEYKRECKMADEGKWVAPTPVEPPQKPTKRNTGKSKGKSKKPSQGSKTAIKETKGNG